MFKRGIKGVDFIVCNTDATALEKSPIPNKIQLGKGLGAGNVPAVAEKAAYEKADEIKSAFENQTQMVFIAAGMGGGTGTGAAPVVAKLLKEIELDDDEVQRILTVAVVNTPYTKEGRRRIEQAKAGIKELRQHVDAIIIVNNDKLREFGGNCGMSQSFARADEILSTAVKGMAEIMTVDSSLHIDFRDVNTVVRDSGVALMSCGEAEGEDRAGKAALQALSSPLLNDSNINGAKNVLLYFSSSPEHEMTHDEWDEITDLILKAAGKDNADLIWGMGLDDSLGEKLSITLVATGFSENDVFSEPKVRRVCIDEQHAPQQPVVESLYQPLQPEVSEKPDLSQYEYSINDELNDIRIISKAEPTANPNTLENSLNLFTQRVATPSATQVVNQLPSQNDDPYLRFEPYEQPKIEAPTVNPERFQVHSTTRIQHLKDLSCKVKTIEGLEEIERIPAYQRRQMKVEEPTHSYSSASEVSRFTLTEDGRVVGNSFLHDNVD
jgi:cell division protein FtsZ